MLTASPTDNAAHYDRVVDAWSFLLGRSLHYGYFESGDEPLDEATTRLTEEMLALLDGPPPGARVLDIGCGTGEPAFHLAARLESSVLGISPSEACVRRARAATPPDLAHLVEFREGDARRLELDDATFDAAWALESSHLIPDKVRLLTEVHRVLVPGGRLAICDLVLRSELDLPEVIRLRDDLLLLNRVFGRAVMKTSDYYVTEATRCGFLVESVADLTTQARPTLDRWARNAAEHRDDVVERLGERSWREFVDSVAVLERLWAEGVLGYWMMAARRS